MAGLLVSSFTLIQILIILFFGIPTTIRLRRANAIGNNNIIKSDVISLIILLSLFLFVFYISIIFSEVFFAGFIFGILWILLFGIGQIGKNSNNVSDYIQANARYFNIEKEEIAKIIMKN